MMGNLGATLDEISWVTTGYMIANSIVLPIAAWLGTRLGRKQYFTGAILIFTAASFACGIAPNLPTLIFFRIIQGLAGGALLPTSQTLIQEQFPARKARDGDGDLRHERDGRPGAGPDAGRLSHR